MPSKLRGGLCWASVYMEEAFGRAQPYDYPGPGECSAVPYGFEAELRGFRLKFPSCLRHTGEVTDRWGELQSAWPFEDYAWKNICLAMRRLLELGARPGTPCHYGSTEVEVVVYGKVSRTQCRRHLRMLFQLTTPDDWYRWFFGLDASGDDERAFWFIYDQYAECARWEGVRFVLGGPDGDSDAEVSAWTLSFRGRPRTAELLITLIARLQGWFEKARRPVPPIVCGFDRDAYQPTVWLIVDRWGPADARFLDVFLYRFDRTELYPYETRPPVRVWVRRPSQEVRREAASPPDDPAVLPARP